MVNISNGKRNELPPATTCVIQLGCARHTVVSSSYDNMLKFYRTAPNQFILLVVSVFLRGQSASINMAEYIGRSTTLSVTSKLIEERGVVTN